MEDDSVELLDECMSGQLCSFKPGWPNFGPVRKGCVWGCLGGCFV